MNIKNISVSVLNIPLIKPFITSLRSVNNLEAIMIKITTNSGIIGFGETAPTFAVTGDSKESIIQAVNVIKKSIIGKNIEDLDEIIETVHNSLEQNFSAKSAIEIALYDIYSKNLKLPLYKYLGGSKRKFKTGITISLNDIDTMVKDSLEAQGKGFHSLKIKLGNDYREDMLRIIEIHKTISSATTLKLDANQGWSPKECVEFLNSMEIENIPIELIEQPVKKDDIAGLKYIKERTSIPILADESIFSPADAIKVLEEGAVDFVNIKLDKCGGISKALQIADICKLYGVKCMIGCMLEGAVSVGAAAHVASAKSETITMLDLDAPMLCKTSPVNGGVSFNVANIRLSKKDGLGIENILGIT